MEALILSCGTGGGHNSAGKAVADELASRGCAVTFMDPYRLVGEHTDEYIGNAYIKIAQRAPKLFGRLYSIAEFYGRFPFHSPVYWANGKMTNAMRRYLSKHSYDCIVTTHLFPAQILAHMVGGQTPLPKTIFIATDYACIPFMQETSCDYYVIPAHDLIDEFCEKGIPRDRILSYGIPVRKDFRSRTEKSEARANLGLTPDNEYILLSGGSIGAGRIVETVEVLQQYLQSDGARRLLVLCGNNQKLYAKLQKRYREHKHIQIMESTSRMAELMSACDLFITKPGGLSSTEAAVCNVPTIHISPIPGCETRNANYFLKHGMSLYAANPKKDLLPAIYSLQNSTKVQDMLQAQKRCIDPNAVVKLCDFIDRTVIGEQNRTRPS